MLQNGLRNGVRATVRMVARIKTQSCVRFIKPSYMWGRMLCVTTAIIAIITEVEYFKGILLNSKIQVHNYVYTLLYVEKGMAAHSSAPAQRVPGTGEPAGLPSMGSQSRTRLKQLGSSSSSYYMCIKIYIREWENMF